MKTQFLFVDTNIWLDFYRIKMDASAKFLRQLETKRDQLIVTYQVEMEYKKNRQAVLLEGLKALRKPESIPQPGVFATAHSARRLRTSIASASKMVSELQSRIVKALEKPSVYDPVYKVFQRCHRRSHDLALTRSMNEKRQVRRDAFRRFLYGYPPRKAGDTSIGDAVNWEWIVRCAKKHDADIHIASRDSDYGQVLDKRTYINDHLAHEFHERVSKRRKIFLHSRLSEALRRLSVSVSAAEALEEDALIKDRHISIQLSKPSVGNPFDPWPYLLQGHEPPIAPWIFGSEAATISAVGDSSHSSKKEDIPANTSGSISAAPPEDKK